MREVTEEYLINSLNGNRPKVILNSPVLRVGRNYYLSGFESIDGKKTDIRVTLKPSEYFNFITASQKKSSTQTATREGN